MAEPLLPPALVELRKRYPAVRSDPAYKGIYALAKDGSPEALEKAEAMAKAASFGSQRARAAHFGALKRRALRRSFLAQQARHELPVKRALAELGDRVGGILARHARGAALRPGRLNAVMADVADANRYAYRDVAKLFNADLRGSVRQGLKDAMASAAHGVVRALAREDAPPEWVEENAIKLAEADPTRQKLKYAADSAVFQKLFKGALRQTMTAAMFGDEGVSPAVWNLRDQNLSTMRRLVAAGIANGDDPASISRDIRGLLVQPKTLRGRARAEARPGPGVYRSAYANAMRLTRTETNRAYVNADVLFAEEKGWMMKWQTSAGHREEDECDELAGDEYTPEDFADKYPQHPQCLCYGVVVPPKEWALA